MTIEVIGIRVGVAWSELDASKPVGLKIHRELDRRFETNFAFQRGIPCTDDVIALLAGAPPGASVMLESGGSFGQKLEWKTHSPVYGRVHRYAAGFYAYLESGALTIDAFATRADAPKGTGTFLFADYLAGIDSLNRRIEAAGNWNTINAFYVDAVGNFETSQDVDARLGAACGGTAGYYFWPRVGFDGEIPLAARDKLPMHLAQHTRLRGLMATPAGRAWWKENGTTVRLRFDLQPGSDSRRTLDAYLKELAPYESSVRQYIKMRLAAG
jgi:hypothetical protein